jgi:hypothetical protein
MGRLGRNAPKREKFLKELLNNAFTQIEKKST